MGAYGAPFTLKRCQSQYQKSNYLVDCKSALVPLTSSTSQSFRHGFLRPACIHSITAAYHNYFVLFCCAYIIPQLPSFVNTLMQSFTIRLQSTTQPQTNRKRRTVQPLFSTVIILYHKFPVLSIRRTTNVESDIMPVTCTSCTKLKLRPLQSAH